MTGGATAQMPYACREGCDRAFLTKLRRDAHEASDHGGKAAALARIDAFVGTDDPEEEAPMAETPNQESDPAVIALCACGKPNRHRGRHRGPQAKPATKRGGASMQPPKVPTSSNGVVVLRLDRDQVATLMALVRGGVTTSDFWDLTDEDHRLVTIHHALREALA